MSLNYIIFQITGSPGQGGAGGGNRRISKGNDTVPTLLGESTLRTKYAILSILCSLVSLSCGQASFGLGDNLYLLAVWYGPLKKGLCKGETKHRNDQRHE